MCMIREDMKFIGYIAFYEQRCRIKEKYLKLNRNDKELYKYYVYSRRQLTVHTCDIIWQFLNNIKGDETLFISDNILQKECKKYRM